MKTLEPTMVLHDIINELEDLSLDLKEKQARQLDRACDILNDVLDQLNDPEENDD